MVGIGAFFNQKEQVKIGSESLGYIILDASLTEGHKRKATITQNQIEDGSNISDHYRVENQSVTIDGVIGEKPISLLDSATNVASSFVSSKVGGLGGIATQALGGILSEEVLKNSNSRQHDNLKKFEEFMNNASIVDVVTGLKTYKNMAIEAIDFPKNAQVGDSLKFNISLVEIKIVQSRLVKLQESVVKGDSAHSAATKQDLGKQKAIEPTGQEEARASIAYNLFN